MFKLMYTHTCTRIWMNQRTNTPLLVFEVALKHLFQISISACSAWVDLKLCPLNYWKKYFHHH